MRERPILFSAPMVRAILAGPKTQTRRPIRWRVAAGEEGLNLSATSLEASAIGDLWTLYSRGRMGLWEGRASARCPYGVPGDRLWVKETWQALNGGSWDEQKPPRQGRCEIRYAATEHGATETTELRGYRWRPSIHMPRWASRITLEVEEVRAQRVQDISEEDAIAEGIPSRRQKLVEDGPEETWYEYAEFVYSSARGAFREMWDSIYGPGAWVRNDWVWAGTFQPVEVRG